MSVLTEESAGAAAIRPFTIPVTPEAEIEALRARIAATRWPDKETVADQSQGVQLATIRELARYWGTEYDFRRLEARLNALPQFVTEIDGLDIHFIHVESPHENALPLIITHGWPGSVIEMLNVVGPLTDPPNGAKNAGSSSSASTRASSSGSRSSSGGSDDWEPLVPVDLPIFLAGLLTGQAAKHTQQRCACAREHGGTGRYMFYSPEGGHYRRSNFARRVFRPAWDGRYEPANGRPGNLVVWTPQHGRASRQRPGRRRYPGSHSLPRPAAAYRIW